MSDYLPSDQIWGIIFFVEHATDYTYVQLMQSLDWVETLGANKYF